MKKIFAVSAILTLALFAVSANAVTPAPATASTTINLSATVSETAALTLMSSADVYFPVTNPNVTTVGDHAVAIAASGTWKKGTTATLSISSADLVGNLGSTMKVSSVSYMADGGSLTPLSIAPMVFKTVTPTAAGWQSFNTNLAFQVLPGSYNPESYTGIVTVTLQVL